MNQGDDTDRDAPGGMTAAVIGLGTIGGTVARHLVGSDISLVVYDIREEATDEFVAGGARRATSCADAAVGADIVIEAVVNDAQVLDVITAADGVLTTLRPGAVIVLHSTVRISTVRQVAAAASAKGVNLLDAGVSTRGAHESGKLAMFVGGDAADLDIARPVLSCYSHCLEYLGPLGSGMTVKLVRNLLGYLFMAGAYESLALAEAVGVDLDAFRRIVEESDVASQAQLVLGMPTTHPFTESEVGAAFLAQMTGLRGAELSSVLESRAAIMEKDIDDILAFADDAGVELEIARDARRLVRQFLLLPPAAGSTHV